MGEMPLSAEGRPDDPDAGVRTVAAALDAGVTLFDTADVSSDGGSEEVLGAALRHDTALVLIETPGNPTLSLVDIEHIVRQADHDFAAGHAHQLHRHVHPPKCGFHGDRLFERHRVIRVDVQQQDGR